MDDNELAEQIKALIGSDRRRADAADNIPPSHDQSVAVDTIVGWSARRFVFGLALMLLMTGVVTFMGQCIAWVKYGFWFPISVFTVLDYFGLPYLTTSEWLGVQRIINWVLDQSFAEVALGVGLLLMVFTREKIG